MSLFSGFFLGQHFSYDGDDGSFHWGDDYPTCTGKQQSPINIDKYNVEDVSLPPLSLIGVKNSYISNIINNGHTVMLKIKNCETPTLSGGPLNDTYVFEQLHFHWGKNDYEGSEHLINNQSYSMEMHAVFYKEAYKSMDEAVKHSDGLTVLAYFYEASFKQNPAFKAIVKALPDIKIASEEKEIHALLKKLLVPNIVSMQDYFTYNGSLTTPPCSEVVKWIVFEAVQRLSYEQVAAFRELQTPEGNKLTHNFRPVQPLEDRIVFYNFPSI